jgi:peptidoglycan/xylan/chitin deacetylase (PgdA/CDA1 family)
VFRSAPGSGKTVALTFDDGPGRSTAQIISILQQAHVTATFFNLGVHEQEQPAMLRTERDDGYALGNHTWDHVDLTTLDAAGQASEMDREMAADSGITGLEPCFFRPPGGAYNGTTLALANARHMQVWNWSVDTEDWKADGSGDQYWIDRITSRAEAGGSQTNPVILMHNQVVGNPATVAALPTIIAFYKSHGYRFVDLFGSTGRPAVTAISPASGGLAGGTRVTVVGTNFDSVIGVQFGAAAGTSVHVVSATELLVSSPPGAAGTADIVVRTRHGSSPPTAADRFSWLPPPTVTTVTPGYSPIAGGTRVTLTGTGFTDVQKVLFGSTPGTLPHVASGTLLLVTAPPGRLGSTQLVVVTSHGTSAPVPFGYYFLVPQAPGPQPVSTCFGTLCLLSRG